MKHFLPFFISKRKSVAAILCDVKIGVGLQCFVNYLNYYNLEIFIWKCLTQNFKLCEESFEVLVRMK